MAFRKVSFSVKTQVWLGFLLCFTSYPLAPIQAQSSRGYSYDSINYLLQVNTDTTVDVTETQTYRFEGEYHQGWRNIPKKDFDDLTDVSVTDEATGQLLAYSSKQLDKTEPSSWNKYTTFYRDGEYVIEWYYDARDTTRTWVLRYTLHGALGFYDDHDELYWNLFTEYTVPIRSVDVDVRLSQVVDDQTQLEEALYVEDVQGGHGSRHTATGFHFFARQLSAGAQMTIAPGWPKGLVDAGAYWRGWWLKNWGFVGAVVTALITPLILLSRWYFTERHRTGRGIVIPEYEPPKNLTPAMADVLVHEKLSPKAWSATVIDLAVRGHLKIHEKNEPLSAAYGFFLAGIVMFFVVSFGVIFLGSFSWGEGIAVFLGLSPLLGFAFLSLIRGGYLFKSFLSPVTYVLEKIEKSTIGGQSLQDYETAFLQALFTKSDSFSLNELRSDRAAARALSVGIQKITRELLQETAGDTRAYAVDFRVWKWLGPVLMVGPGIFVGAMFALSDGGSVNGSVVFFSTLAFCTAAGYLFFRYNPRLNRDGQILREEWLGFKLYLETAERYRLQNLTPETFEKYLPYAIIFGVEKAWGKAFEGLALSSPSWYSSSTLSASRFSASGFSTSFSASFASAFASAGGGGASGGGGSAGGGGGGGGGGAS